MYFLLRLPLRAAHSPQVTNLNVRSLTMNKLFVLSLAIPCLTACLEPGAEGNADINAVHTESVASALTNQYGGTVPSATLRRELSALVTIGACDAVKVGPRHFLTAASCLVKEPEFGGQLPLKNSQLLITSRFSDNDSALPQAINARVERVIFDGSWWAPCRKEIFAIHPDTCRGANFIRKGMVSEGGVTDLALVLVRDFATGPNSVRRLATLPVSAQALTANQNVTVAGFKDGSCSIVLPSGEPANGCPEFRVGTTTVLASASGAVGNDINLLKSRYNITGCNGGPLCTLTTGQGYPADQGAALLVKRNNQWMVGGVIAERTFPDQYDSAYYNYRAIASWHTRLDNGSSIRPLEQDGFLGIRREPGPAVGVADWLASEGVSVVR